MGRCVQRPVVVLGGKIKTGQKERNKNMNIEEMLEISDCPLCEGGAYGPQSFWHHAASICRPYNR